MRLNFEKRSLQNVDITLSGMISHGSEGSEDFY